MFTRKTDAPSRRDAAGSAGSDVGSIAPSSLKKTPDAMPKPGDASIASR
jgi:hypothetical protein